MKFYALNALINLSVEKLITFARSFCLTGDLCMIQNFTIRFSSRAVFGHRMVNFFSIYKSPVNPNDTPNISPSEYKPLRIYAEDPL